MSPRLVPNLRVIGHALADDMLRDIVSQFESVYPDRISGCYVEGSYADQTAVATSDLDLTLVFATTLTMSERERVNRIVQDCQQTSALELDVRLTDEQQLREHADPMFKLGARLVYGQDVRDRIPLISMNTWARQRMHAAYWLMINIFQRPQPVRAPLTLPQPNAPFYGYTARTMRLRDGAEIPTTRNLIRVTGWIATARLAVEAQQYVIRKRDCAPTYRRLINDQWTALLEEIDQRCRTAWQYRIPDTASEQAELRAILERTPEFENHFLNRYRQFLVAELLSMESVAQRAAVEMLQRTLYADPTVMRALQQVLTMLEPQVYASAQELISQWEALHG